MQTARQAGTTAPTCTTATNDAQKTTIDPPHDATHPTTAITPTFPFQPQSPAPHAAPLPTHPFLPAITPMIQDPPPTFNGDLTNQRHDAPHDANFAYAPTDLADSPKQSITSSELKHVGDSPDQQTKPQQFHMATGHTPTRPSDSTPASPAAAPIKPASASTPDAVHHNRPGSCELNGQKSATQSPAEKAPRTTTALMPFSKRQHKTKATKANGSPQRTETAPDGAQQST